MAREIVLQNENAVSVSTPHFGILTQPHTYPLLVIGTKAELEEKRKQTILRQGCELKIYERIM